MSDLVKNQSSFGRPEEDGLRPYSETLPNWNELSDGTRAMLNDIDGIRPYKMDWDQLIAKEKTKLRKEQTKA